MIKCKTLRIVNETHSEALQALKELATLLSAGATVGWCDGTEIRVSRLVNGCTETATFSGTGSEMAALNKVETCLARYNRLKREAMQNPEGAFSLDLDNVRSAERPMIQALQTALQESQLWQSDEQRRVVLFVVLSLGITEEPDLAAASRLEIDDLFAVIGLMQSQDISLAQAAQKLQATLS